MNAFLLGLDVGSSSLKAGLFTAEGEPVAVSSQSYPTSEPSPGHREQDPEDWWSAAVASIRQMTARVSHGAIAAVGVAGHISSFTFVDKQGRVLRPCVGFQDQRAAAELDELYGTFSRSELSERLGIDLPPAATWPLPRLLWFRNHEPRTLARAHRLLQAKDLVNFRLTGNFCGDASSNRGMVNFASNRVAGDVFERLSLNPELLPPLHAPDEVIGHVTPQASAETGLPAGMPVICGWNDLNASVLGSGNVRPGDAFNITGTSEHVGVVTEAAYRVPELVCAPFLPGRKLLYGVTSCGGGSLEWYASVAGRELADVISAAAQIWPEEAPLFLPYLEGERSPVWDPWASGAFVGLKTVQEAGHLVRGVLQGVAFSLRQILEIVDANQPLESTPLILSGGAARVRLWNQIKADVWKRAVTAARNRHTGVLGAAMLAAVGARLYESPEQAASAMARTGERFEPDAHNASAYDRSYALFRELYPALSGIMARMHQDRSQVRVSHVA